jgi:MYXO-CTERM domain-containing protein
MTIFGEMSKEAMKWAVWAALAVGFIAGVLRRRR